MFLPLGLIENVGPTELLVILGIILVLFGGKKLPELANSLGRSIGEFKKGKQEGENLSREEMKQIDASKEAPAKNEGPKA